MNERRVRLAIAGAGLMGKQVADAAATLPGVAVTAVVDADAGRAHALAAEHGARAGQTIAAIADVADAVYVGAPSHLHAALCVEAAAAGLHVLVDKPLCLDGAEADAIRAALGPGIRLMVGFSYRYRREWTEAKRWLEEGEIGAPLLLVDTIFEAAASTPRWYWEASQGGGVVQLQAHHCFDRAAWLLDDAVRVTAATAEPGDGGEDRATILGRSGRGALLTIALGFARTYTAPGLASFLIQGDRGHLVIDSMARSATLSTGGATRVVTAVEDDWMPREVAAFVGLVRGDLDPASVPGWAEGCAAVTAAEQSISFIRAGIDARIATATGTGE
ncbi:Gfo/Idh/MocA family protein [Jiangella muralis]|uniref:Gfo/Idh/MocA family protein n=1 Tax=Jiangella muralis TaxID=702383 RepID=UPI000AF88333|nr:Gfo/Idh/MocA family oxidoreductase [Jiangella muralis]